MFSTLSILLAGFSAFTPLSQAQDSCTQVNVQTISHVDMTAVRNAWLGWYNDYRATQGLSPYTLDTSLDTTAGNWSLFAAKRGTISHKRTWKAAYYDYDAIEQWFAAKGLTFKNVSSRTFTENIGWGIYDCDSADCTQEMIDSIRTTFDFFMSEKGKANSSHYNTIVSPQFTKMGVGIAVDPATSRYYLTAHFATDFSSSPPAFCQ